MSDQTKNGREAKRAEFAELLGNSVSEAVKAGLVDVTDAIRLQNERIDAFEKKQEEMELSQRKHNLPGAEEETYEGETYNFGRVFKGLITGRPEKECPMELAMSEELFAQGTVPDTAGGFLVPTQVFEDQIIPLLRPRVIVMDLGITQLPVTGAGVIEIPRETTGPVVDTVAENNANTASDLTFGNHEMRPKTAQSYVKASRRFLQLGVGADQFIRRRMAEELALTWNAWTLKGAGASGEPIGVYNATGVNSVDFSGLASADDPGLYLKLLEMEDALADANALSGATSLGWALANKAFRAMRQMKSENASAGTASLDVNRKLFSEGAETQVLGYRFQRTTQLDSGTDTEMIFGDWSKAVLATWNNLSIEASNVASDALAKRQTHIVAYIDVDVAVTQPTAFAVSSGYDTSGI
jgi:HK97 family phage major capsid protein